MSGWRVEKWAQHFTKLRCSAVSWPAYVGLHENLEKQLWCQPVHAHYLKHLAQL